jgi:hypothetical protein
VDGKIVSEMRRENGGFVECLWDEYRQSCISECSRTLSAKAILEQPRWLMLPDFSFAGSFSTSLSFSGIEAASTLSSQGLPFTMRRSSHKSSWECRRSIDQSPLESPKNSPGSPAPLDLRSTRLNFNARTCLAHTIVNWRLILCSCL